jgi:cyclomaltodextrinase
MAILPTMPLDVPREVQFRFKPSVEQSVDLKTVHVVGGFNAWDKARHPLTAGPDGTWTATLAIEPGVYDYLFVLNGNKWVPDPHAPLKPDLNGNKNSVLMVQPEAFDKYPGKKGDGRITHEAVLHRPLPADSMRVNERSFGVFLRTRTKDVSRVQLHLEGAKPIAMRVVRQTELYDTWYAKAPISGISNYHFELQDGGTTLRYPEVEAFSQAFGDYPLPSPPDWVRDAVFYQIFPDRFANGDPSNDRPGTVRWGTKPRPSTWMGGDLQGVLNHLNHITELGATAIYFNPVFQTISYHGYDTVDYKRIEPTWGTNELFADLVRQSHSLGLRIMLDGVFNHSNTNHPFFLDLIEKGEKSSYASWYYPLKFPIDTSEGQQTYRGWAGVRSMPKLNTSNPDVQEFVADVGSFWIREYGIDAWRLDVADEVDPACWRVFRSAVRDANPQAYILGEAWHDPRPWVQGDQHDATMNYQWRKAVLDLFANRSIGVKEFESQLRNSRELIPESTVGVQFNVLGSHDTPRLLTLMGGNVARMKQAVAFQFCYPGVPSVYYGDEIGLTGGHDPDCRKGMTFDRRRWNKDIYEHFSSMIQLRTSSNALRRGAYKTRFLDQKSQLFGFERVHGKERVKVLFNLSGEWRDLPAGWVEEGLRGLDEIVPGRIAPDGYVILKNY